MTTEDIIRVFELAYQRKAKGKIRLGQALSNALHEVAPDVCEQIIGTDNDPFYDNNNIGGFSTYLAKLVK